MTTEEKTKQNTNLVYAGIAIIILIGIYYFVIKKPTTAAGGGAAAPGTSAAYMGYSIIDPTQKTGWAMSQVVQATLAAYLTGGNNPQNNGVTQQQNYSNLKSSYGGNFTPALPQPNTGTGFVGVPGKGSSSSSGSSTPSASSIVSTITTIGALL